jgi:alpha-ketoglutarate-dependent taurine dioxygenase
MGLHVRPTGDALGAEISGVDLGAPLQSGELEVIRKAWARHRVLAFRDQAVDDAGHARFAGLFGALADFGRRADAATGSAAVYCSSNADDAGCLLSPSDERARELLINWFWHTDGCYRRTPNRGVVLRAVEVPASGGDTLFANMEAAYAALPQATQRRADRLVCRHSFARMLEQCGMRAPAPGEATRLPTAWHPLVWQHAGGKRSLFLSPPYMERLCGPGLFETGAFIAELVEWASQQRFLYRHQWRAGDVLMWDNHWTMHKVSPYDLARQKRIMRGATLIGNAPVARVVAGVAPPRRSRP